MSLTSIKSVVDWLVSLREKWVKWSEARERRKPQNSVAQVVKWMDEIEQKVRKEQNVWGYSPVFDDASWWSEKLSGVLPDVIQEAIKVREKKREQLRQQYPR